MKLWLKAVSLSHNLSASYWLYESGHWAWNTSLIREREPSQPELIILCGDVLPCFRLKVNFVLLNRMYHMGPGQPHYYVYPCEEGIEFFYYSTKRVLADKLPVLAVRKDPLVMGPWHLLQKLILLCLSRALYIQRLIGLCFPCALWYQYAVNTSVWTFLVTGNRCH